MSKMGARAIVAMASMLGVPMMVGLGPGSPDDEPIPDTIRPEDLRALNEAKAKRDRKTLKRLLDEKRRKEGRGK